MALHQHIQPIKSNKNAKVFTQKANKCSKHLHGRVNSCAQEIQNSCAEEFAHLLFG